MIFDSEKTWQERVRQRCREQAIGHAGGLTLPLSARSLTKAEAVAKDGGPAFILYLLTAMTFLVGAGLIVGSGEALGRKLVWTGALGMVTFAMYFLARARGDRRRAYVDPGIMVEVTDEGVTVRDGGAAHALPDHQPRYEFTYYSHRDSISFLGIKLQSPIGLIDLQDKCYVGARDAAAAIVLRAEREKIEGGLLRVG